MMNKEIIMEWIDKAQGSWTTRELCCFAAMGITIGFVAETLASCLLGIISMNIVFHYFRYVVEKKTTEEIKKKNDIRQMILQ